MLHSAVLRALRMSGRPELIEEEIARADHLWLAMKCLLERSRAAQRGPELASRLKGLVEASPCRGNALLHRVIAEIGGSSLTPPAAGTPSATGQPPESAVVRIGYGEAVHVLSGEDAGFKPASPLVLDRLTPEQCEHLIKTADPINDSDRGVETYVPSVEFTQNGHVVARRRVTFAGGAESARALIRPAVAAANSFGLPNSWHEELLAGPLAATYLPKYLVCLGARDESDRFYEELIQHEELLVPLLCNAQQAQPVLKYVDERIVPFLARYVSSGTDELFEGLCVLALRVETPEIDPVLAGLLHRWVRRFDVRAIVLQHDQNHALWRGFNRLAEHPHFILIKGWQSALASVLPAPLSWFRAENIVRVLERDPRSYILIESRLFKAANWEHFHWDEIDRLDAAGERLFYELLEE